MTDPTPEPCLSVVMPCYNEKATIEEVVGSVLASPWTAELVIVDDGSVDGTRDILATFDDPGAVSARIGARFVAGLRRRTATPVTTDRWWRRLVG